LISYLHIHKQGITKHVFRGFPYGFFLHIAALYNKVKVNSNSQLIIKDHFVGRLSEIQVKKEYEVKMSNTVKITKVLLYSILALFLVGTIINCGGGASSAPAQVQAPKALIQDYIAKHGTMVDDSLVDFYVAAEQPTVAAAIQRSIDEKKAAGELQGLQQATFDFSNLQIAVVGEKEAYINDEPKKVIKVSVSGSYIMKQENGSTTIPANDTIILEMVNNNWKVTERINPWS